MKSLPFDKDRKASPDQLRRYAEALAMGDVADYLFEQQCRARRISPKVAISAPLDYLSFPPMENDAARH